jgi:hypothetical protein
MEPGSGKNEEESMNLLPPDRGGFSPSSSPLFGELLLLLPLPLALFTRVVPIFLLCILFLYCLPSSLGRHNIGHGRGFPRPLGIFMY